MALVPVRQRNVPVEEVDDVPLPPGWGSRRRSRRLRNQKDNGGDTGEEEVCECEEPILYPPPPFYNRARDPTLSDRYALVSDVDTAVLKVREEYRHERKLTLAMALMLVIGALLGAWGFVTFIDALRSRN